VTKKDGYTRFCVDYRKLNDVTVKDAYPLPLISDCVEALSGAKYIGTMDVNSGFWQVGLDPMNREKTAFSTSLGLYQFVSMPFGLCSSPSTFQRLMQNVLRGLHWEECQLYMDDVIVPGASFQESLLRMEHTFDRLLSARLKLKLSKFIFFQSNVKFLGHVVSEEGISTDLDQVKAVQDWPRQKTPKQMRGFLGLCSYYRKYVKNFATIARPLHKLCEKGSRFQWNDECEQAFIRLKDALTSPPILSYPRPGCQFIVDSDASDKAVGAVLSQVQEGTEKVIAYMSKALNQHEQIYCVTRKELLAVMCALRNFHSYLYGQEVLLRTNNAAVSWMKSLKMPNGQVARWLQEIGKL
jgi:hypothetical protein